MYDNLQVEQHLQEIIKTLLRIPDADLPEFKNDPYDNGMRIRIERELERGRTGPDLIIHTLTGMDGKRIDQFRERNGRKWRREVTSRFLDQYSSSSSNSSSTRATAIGLHFTYAPYTGITHDISSDWTSLFDGILPMGDLTFFLTQDERDRSLKDEDTGERWPENEIWACGTREALFHILRLQQRAGSGRLTQHTRCGCDGPCTPEGECGRKAEPILEQVYQDFLEWMSQEKE